MDHVVVQEIQSNAGATCLPVSQPARSPLFVAVTGRYSEWQKEVLCGGLCHMYQSGMHSLLCPRLHDRWRQGKKAA